jgi:large subunit ribosomal protein L9
VNVKHGYGRNYLIPQGLAILANKSNRKMIDENIKQAAHKAEKIRNDAEALAESIGDLKLKVGAKVGESGKIFGAVTTLQIADLLANKGFEIDRKQIAFSEQPKEVGEYVAILDLHKEVKHELKFEVVPE